MNEVTPMSPRENGAPERRPVHDLVAERRLAIASVAYCYLADMIACRRLPASTNAPDDLVVVDIVREQSGFGMLPDGFGGTLRVIVASETFESVTEGHMLPEVVFTYTVADQAGA